MKEIKLAEDRLSNAELNLQILDREIEDVRGLLFALNARRITLLTERNHARKNAKTVSYRTRYREAKSFK